MNGVGGFFGVPRLVVRGSEDCGVGIVGGCSSGAVDTGFGTASLEERAGVAIRDFLLIGTALARGAGSLAGWTAGCGSGSGTSTSVSAVSSSGSSADVRGTKGSKALADTLEVRAFVFGGSSGESDSNSRTCVRVSFHCTLLRTSGLSLCTFSTASTSAKSPVESSSETISSPTTNSLA